MNVTNLDSMIGEVMTDIGALLNKIDSCILLYSDNHGFDMLRPNGDIYRYSGRIHIATVHFSNLKRFLSSPDRVPREAYIRAVLGNIKPKLGV